MDEASVGREGRNAVGHVQEQGVQLVALALHLADRCLETARHVVERARQLTDLVARLHAEVLIEVALRDRPRALGNALDRSRDGLGQQKGQQDRREQTEHHRLHDDLEKAPRQVGDLLLVVRDIHDIVHRSVAVVVERNRDVHHAVRDRRARAGFAGHRRDDVARARDAKIGVGAVHKAALAVEDIIVAVVVDAETAAMGIDDGLEPLRVRRCRRLLHGADGIGRKNALHLGIKAVDVERADAVDEKGADDGHDRHDHQDQNKHQLHMQRTKQNDTPMGMDWSRALSPPQSNSPCRAW